MTRTAITIGAAAIALVGGISIVGAMRLGGANGEDAVMRSVWRRQYDEARIELDNLRDGIVRSHDAEAERLDKGRSKYTVVRSSVQAADAGPVKAYDPAMSYDSAARALERRAGVRDAEVALDVDGHPRLVTLVGAWQRGSSRFYLDNQGTLFLVVRTSEDHPGVENEDRWYFVDGTFVTFRFRLGSDEKEGTWTVYTPDTPEDIANLRAELREALDRTRR